MWRNVARFACLLALVGCDSAEDSSPAECGFSATTDGLVTENLAGRAFYFRSADVNSHLIDLTVSSVNGTISNITLAGQLRVSRPEGAYAFNTPPSSGGGWFGAVNGTLPLQSTEGTLRILSLSDTRIEGRFNMTAETDDARTVTVEGQFNAGTECPLQ